MTWTKIKIYFEKTLAWCVQHWRWLVFGLVALIAYLSGRKSARNMWLKAELARKQYKAEAAAIEKAHADKDEKRKKAEADYKVAIAELDANLKKKNSDLDKEKAKEYKRMLKSARNNPNELDRILQDMGIKKDD